MSPEEKANVVVDVVRSGVEEDLDAGWYVFGLEESTKEYYEVSDLVDSVLYLRNSH